MASIDENSIICHFLSMKPIRDPKSVHTLLQDKGGSDLRKIIRQAQRLLSMNTMLDNYLPDELKSHCQVAQITPTTWTLIVDSAAWLTHLRYLKPELLRQLKKHPQCAHLKELQYRIQPAQRLPEKKEAINIPRQLSAEAKHAINQTAEDVSNPLLKRALKKLASKKRGSGLTS